jgi:hypothetical protein
LALVFLSSLLEELARPRSKTKDITIDALSSLGIIIAVMGAVPQLGYIRDFALAFFDLDASSGFDRGLSFWLEEGARSMALAFGITSWIEALLTGQRGFNALFIVPWVSVLPADVFGFLSGLPFNFSRKLLR